MPNWAWLESAIWDASVVIVRPSVRTSALPLGLARAALLCAAIVSAIAVVTPDALAHTGSRIAPPSEKLSAWAAGFEFSKYGAKHILLGYDHLLFLAGLTLLSRGLRDVLAVVGLFALSYSTTLIGGTLLEIEVSGNPIDALIALSVGLVGAQIAFGAEGGRLPRNPRGPALVFGLAHGLGLSSLLQELQLPGDDVLPSVIGFNVGVELGQVAVIAALIGVMVALRAFPFPVRERLPAGFAFLSAGGVLLVFVVFGVSL